MKKSLNFQKKMAVVGLLGLAVPVSLTVVACSTKETVTNNDQQIVDAINKVTYITEVNFGSKTSNLKATITPEFIKSQLSGEIKKAFNISAFSLNKIIKRNGTEVSNSNLTVPGTVKAKIIYSYGSIKNQTTNLTINVSVSDQQIVDAINNQQYLLTVAINTQVNEVNQLINANFIKNKLSNNISSAFSDRSFNFAKISTNNKDLTSDDLNKITEIKTKIIYSYGSIKNQTTNLTIKIVHVSAAEIAKAIGEAKYYVNVSAGTKAKKVNQIVNADFIKAQLPSQFKTAFSKEKLHLAPIEVYGDAGHNKLLTDDDLKNHSSRSLLAVIGYEYGSIKKMVTWLYITIE